MSVTKKGGKRYSERREMTHATYTVFEPDHTYREQEQSFYGVLISSAAILTVED
jgi:hypothetical protein